MTQGAYPIQSLANGLILWSDGSKTGGMSTPSGQVSNQSSGPLQNTYQPPAPQIPQDPAAEQWNRLHQGEGTQPIGYNGEDEGGNLADTLLQAVTDPMTELFKQWSGKLAEFDKNNPFAFDEVQAKASAGS